MNQSYSHHRMIQMKSSLSNRINQGLIFIGDASCVQKGSVTHEFDSKRTPFTIKEQQQ